eukprot:Rhum_TRINITY_DN16984_c0_g1::Rhum_TRINITY_DN16984_c0_g1_i1::g.164958::m.164958
MAKSKRSKVKQMHKRAFSARTKPEVDARIQALHNKCMGKTGDEEMKDVTAAPVQAAAPTPTPVDLTGSGVSVNSLAKRGSVKARAGGPVVGKIQKSTRVNPRMKEEEKRKIKLRVIGDKKRVVS